MKILFIYPLYPDSFWSFRHALRFISKKAGVPPLGLITVSALLPKTWQKRLVDLNVAPLKTSDLLWADYAFISAMYIQKDSVDVILEQCLRNKVKIVAGGPLFTQESENYPQIDHMILNEAEITMPMFLADLEAGRVPQKIYRTEKYADISLSPVPDYSLLSRKDYASMNIQVTRGCPFACDFCEITSLLGHKVRMKDTSQVIAELDKLYELNWRGPVSIVDDNFIGNKREVKTDLLPAMGKWMRRHNFPFSYTIQSSINLADDDELMSLMVAAGINSAFIGIETPSEESLADCNKVQNRNRDLLNSVRTIQQAGLQVSGGFIVGFDTDTQAVFQKQVDFIQQSGIVSAMVGLLNAPKNTKLYERLDSENRITVEASGNNTDYSMNFIPRMSEHELIGGYRTILRDIYTTKPYYKRIRKLLLNYRPGPKRSGTISMASLSAFIKVIIIIGIMNKGRRNYWTFMAWTLFRRPKMVVDAVTFTVYGYHFRKIFGLTG